MVHTGVVDESEIGAIDEASEGIEEEVECRDGRKEKMEEEEEEEKNQRSFHTSEIRHRHRRGKRRAC